MESAEVSSRVNEHFDKSITGKAATLPALIRVTLCPCSIHHASSRVRPVPRKHTLFGETAYHGRAEAYLVGNLYGESSDVT